MISLLNTLNGSWHRRANQIFSMIVLAHWAEHVVQAYQVYLLGRPRPHSHGAFGLVFPWLITSETLHYGYNLAMLAGFILLRPGFVGRARPWWNAALGIQAWHFFEHALLLGQVLLKRNLFDSSVPVSLLQMAVPRVELHLFYNAIVFFPMIVAIGFHLFPGLRKAQAAACACAPVYWSSKMKNVP